MTTTSFEVKLQRQARQIVHTTVSVTAETEQDAIAQAISFARAQGEWSSDFTDPAEYGEIEVVGVEPIVELEDNAAT